MEGFQPVFRRGGFLGQKAYSQVQEMLVSGIYTKNVISSWRLLLTWSFTKKIHWKLLALRGCWDPYKAIFIPITHDSPPKVSAMDQSTRCPTSPPPTEEETAGEVAEEAIDADVPLANGWKDRRDRWYIDLTIELGVDQVRHPKKT